MTPYGKADEALEPSKIFKRLQQFMCEWFSRSDVALSEYSDTITSNIPILQEHGKDVLTKSFAAKLKTHFEPIWENLNALNKTNTESTPTTSDAKNVLRSMLDNDGLDKEMEKIFLLSGAMFAISTNYLVSTSIVRHPEEFSKLVISENNCPAASFRERGSVQAMKNYVLDAFKQSSSQKLSRKAAKSVTKAFGDSPSESESESDSEPSTSTKKKPRTRKQQRHSSL